MSHLLDPLTHPHPMKYTLLLTASSLLIISLSSPAAELAGGQVYSISSGSLQQLPAGEYKGHLLPTMMDYAARLGQPGKEAEAEHYRRRAIALARRFPEEVNDLHIGTNRHGEPWATPLSLAVQAQDAALVSLLLRCGAFPLTPQAELKLSELPLLPGVSPNEEVAKALQHHSKRHNPLLALMAQHSRQPQEPGPYAKLSPTLRQLAEAYETTYIGDPRGLWDWSLYEAYRNLPSPKSLILQVQPLARMVEQPLPLVEGERRHLRNLYAHIHYRARIVKAFKGKQPEQEFITWAELHEGPVNGAPDGQWVGQPVDAEPMVVDVANHGLAREPGAEGDTLALGRIDSFATWSGHQWVQAYEQVIADYPEILETTPATPEELAAAHALMEQAPCLVRATIVGAESREGETHYTARLRDPLAGAVIKGVLKDWSDLHYTRPQAEGQAPLPEGTPVILVLEGDENAPRVQQAIDAENDAALFRAINESVFFPWKEH